MFNGVIVPAVTLLQRDGSIDLQQNRTHIDYLIDSLVQGIYLFGITGEFMHFNLREREGFAASIVEHVDGRVPVIVGAASTATDDAVRLSRHAQGIGASAVTVTTPYFWTLSEREVMGHFSTVASSVDIPIIVYNVPTYSGFNVSNSALVALVREHENIVGVIDTVDSTEHLRSRIDELRGINPTFTILTGTDVQSLSLLELGGNGSIASTANIVPHVHVQMVDAFNAGDYRVAVDRYQKLGQVLRLYGVEGSFHSVIKEALVILGRATTATVRSPALPLTPENRAVLRDILRRAELIETNGEG